MSRRWISAGATVTFVLAAVAGVAGNQLAADAVWAWILFGAVLVLGGAVTWFTADRVDEPRDRRSGPQISIRVSNGLPVYDLPGGNQHLGDHHVLADVTNDGGRPLWITGWGVKLPGDRRIVVTQPVNWATPLPYQLMPDALPARLVMPAEDLRRVHREAGIPYEDMRPFFMLANGTEILAERTVPLA